MVVLEVSQREGSTIRPEELTRAAEAVYRSHELQRGAGRFGEGELLDFGSDRDLTEHVTHLRVCDVDQSGLTVYVHALYDEEPAEETTEGGDGETVAFQMWSLPSLELDGLWESLLFDEEEARLKPNLLRYVGTAMRFSDLGVDPRVVACNRIVMLHGPPGTGKSRLPTPPLLYSRGPPAQGRAHHAYLPLPLRPYSQARRPCARAWRRSSPSG
jgi:hypothetical protein